MIDVVKQAKSMGVYTIVTDWHELDRSPAKRIADEYWVISIMDYDQLIDKIKEKKIDGVLTGFTDVFLLPYQHLCELAGLPCYATKEQFEWTLDKSLFKKKCQEYGVPVVPEYSIKDVDCLTISPTHKIIIKPVDSSGSIGISVCDKANEFEEKLSYSLSFSKKKEVVIERYMDCDDVSFEYKIQEGVIVLSAMCDRYIYHSTGGGSVTSCLVYPSRYLDEYLKEMNAKVCGLFEAEGLQNGVLMMQAFYEDGEFYFYEMGYRLSGGRHYIFTKHQNDESALEDLINFAVTGKMADYRIKDRVNPKFKSVCVQLAVICSSDRISSIEGWDAIASFPEIIDANRVYNIGDVVGEQGTTSSIFAKIHIVADDIQQANSVVGHVFNTLHVINDNGKDMVLNRDLAVLE